MLREIINASSKPGDVVADFFMGSGTTIKAALSLGRKAIGVEMEAGCFDQTVAEIRTSKIDNNTDAMLKTAHKTN